MKKVLILLALLLLLITSNAEVKKATLVNYNTDTKVVVELSNKANIKRLFSLGYKVYNTDNLGFNVVSSFKTTLSSSMTSTQTTLPISSITTKDGHTITMADLGSKVYLTIEPGATNEEIVVCTGISGKTFTPCTRGLAYYGTSTASVAGNKKTHQSGSSVVMSNVNYTLKEFVDKDSNETIGGQKSWSAQAYFSYLPTSTTTAPTTDGTLSNKKYVDDIAFAGAPNALYTNKGIIQLATSSQISLGTKLGSSGAYLVPTNESFKSSSTARNIVPVTRSSGKLDKGFIDTAQTYAWTNTNTFATTTSATSTVTGKLVVGTSEVKGNVKAFTATTTLSLLSAVYINSKGFVARTDAGTSTAINFAGFALNSASVGGSARIQTSGIVSGFSSLTKGSYYYLNGDGGITKASSTLIRMTVGIAVSDTEVLIQPIERTAMGVGTIAKNTVATQVVSHDLGRIPTHISINATTESTAVSAGLSLSFGNAYTSGGTEGCSYQAIYSGGNGAGGNQTTIIYLVDYAGSVLAQASISNVNSTTFTLNWTTNSNVGLARNYSWTAR